MKKGYDKVKSLLAYGTDIAGTVTGTAIGLLTGGPAGAVFGGAFGAALRRGLSDIANRVLSNRERMRVGATATFALAKIKARMDSGQELRSDGFFDKKQTGRADADEIFEGVLLKAKNMHEEKKAKILGNIFANVAFSTGFSVGEANHLLQIAEDLAYRQMCILSLIKRKDELPGIKLKSEPYGEERITEIDSGINIDFSSKTASILQQTYELVNRGLVICTSAKPDITVLMTAFDIAPDELLLTIMGIKYYKIMELDDIDEQDIREVAKYLS